MSDHEPARRLNLMGEVARNHEATALAAHPGDAALVYRGKLRSIVIACPDGCGQHLTINLDTDAGPAWRLYQRKRGLTIFPSVWRATGCKSHFIVWHDAILWCEAFTDGNREPDAEQINALRAAVLGRLGQKFQSYVDVALTLDEIRWEVNRVCRRLKTEGLVEEGRAALRGQFRLREFAVSV